MDLTPLPPMTSLRDYLKAHPPSGAFTPSMTYSIIGDLLSVYLFDDPAYAENLTPDIIVLRSFSDNRVVGVKLCGVEDLINRREKQGDDVLHTKGS